MANVRTCTHIKVTGVRCGSPALREEEYCYFHYRMLCESRVSHVALLENEEAIQVSLMEVVNSLLRGTIDLKRGELVLRALNTAVRNSRRARFDNHKNMVRALPEPAEPVVQPRSRDYTREELDKMQKEMWAEYRKTQQAEAAAQASKSSPPPPPKESASAPSTTKEGVDASASVPRTESRSPAPAPPVRNSQAGKTNVDLTRRKSHTGEIDPKQHKPPAAVKEAAAPKERKNTAHGVSRGKAG